MRSHAIRCRLLALPWILALCACFDAQPDQDRNPPRTSLTHPELLPDDLAVYAALFAERGEVSLHVVRELHTSSGRLPDRESSPVDSWAAWRDLSGAYISRPVPASLVHGFSDLVAPPGELPGLLVLPAGWRFVERADFERLCAAAAAQDPPQQSAWIEAVGPEGTLQLSRVVFSADGGWALVLVSWFGGPMAGGYGVRALQRTTEGWRVIAVLPLGSS